MASLQSGSPRADTPPSTSPDVLPSATASTDTHASHSPTPPCSIPIRPRSRSLPARSPPAALPPPAAHDRSHSSEIPTPTVPPHSNRPSPPPAKPSLVLRPPLAAQPSPT